MQWPGVLEQSRAVVLPSAVNSFVRSSIHYMMLHVHGVRCAEWSRSGHVRLSDIGSVTRYAVWPLRNSDVPSSRIRKAKYYTTRMLAMRSSGAALV